MKNQASGPPKCSCSICDELVLKSTTKHIGDGKRACVKHDGVVNKADELKTQEKTRVQALNRKIGEKRILNDRKSWDFTPKCFCCGKKGMEDYKLNYQILMMWKIYEKTTGERVNPLNPSEEVKAIISESFKKTFGYVPTALAIVNAEKIPEDVKRKIIKEYMLRFAPLFSICHDCMTKYAIYQYTDKPKIDMDIKNIMLLGSIMNSTMDEEIDKLMKEHSEEKE